MIARRQVSTDADLLIRLPLLAHERSTWPTNRQVSDGSLPLLMFVFHSARDGRLPSLGPSASTP